jgi:hypothetical protein
MEQDLEALFQIPVGEFTAADRVKGENLKRQIADLRRIAGISGSAKAAVTGTQAASGGGGGDLLSQAQSAIANGAPAEAVRARYKELTGTDLP